MQPTDCLYCSSRRLSRRVCSCLWRRSVSVASSLGNVSRTLRVSVLYCLLDTFIVSTYDLRMAPSRT